jgi:hypothetical protein
MIFWNDRRFLSGADDGLSRRAATDLTMLIACALASFAASKNVTAPKRTLITGANRKYATNRIGAKAEKEKEIDAGVEEWGQEMACHQTAADSCRHLLSVVSCNRVSVASCIALSNLRAKIPKR